jgi:uncharacterized membrane protein YciS (DUF1049 family)
VRNALILLVAVAVLILAVGALNNETAFDVDYVAGTVGAVSLFWVSAVIAALVFVVGLAAAWFAKSAVAGSRRKLEAELQSTYERLREAEALVARPAPAPEPAPVAAVVPAEVAEAETVVAAEEATVVAGADETASAREDVTLIAGEEATVVADERGTDVASEVPGEPGEQTAVTMAGATPAGEAGAPAGDAGADGADETRAAGSRAEDAAAGEGEGEAGRTGS